MMGDKRSAALTDTMTQLSDLIVALDRRLPQMQRMGEAAIVNAAARLRRDAVARLREIEREIEGDIEGQESHDSRPADTL